MVIAALAIMFLLDIDDTLMVHSFRPIANVLSDACHTLKLCNCQQIDATDDYQE